MIFPLSLLNIFALTGFIVHWLSLSYMALKIYRSGSNQDSAIALAKTSMVLKKVLFGWAILTVLITSVTTDTAGSGMTMFIITSSFFMGLYYFIQRYYKDLLNKLNSIRKSGDQPETKALIKSSGSLAKASKNKKTSINVQQDFKNFRTFYIILDALICMGMIINFWVNDSGRESWFGLIFIPISLAISIQIIFVPLYLLVKKIILMTAD